MNAIQFPFQFDPHRMQKELPLMKANLLHLDNASLVETIKDMDLAIAAKS